MIFSEIMPGIDRLISSSLTHIIKNKLNSDILKNLERKLFLEHGMSIKISIENFGKFDKTLKSILDSDVKKFENECIDQVIKIKKLDNVYSVKIIDQKLINLILESIGDQETRIILNCLFDNELTIPQILDESKVAKTSGYRKIENLIINGLIFESGKISNESRMIFKYKCIFDEIKIVMKKNVVIIHGIINKKIFDKSTSINIIN